MVTSVVVGLAMLICPALTIAFGKILLNLPPGEPNCAYGYRSRRASMSKESWNFAQGFSGRYLVKLGRVSLSVSFLAAIAVVLILGVLGFGESALVLNLSVYVPIVAQVLALLSVVPVTERELKRRFAGNGIHA